jgi:replicative DNA helicase
MPRFSPTLKPTLAKFADDRNQGEPETAAQAVIEVMRRLDDGASRGGLMTGVIDLDGMTGGH